MKNKITKIGFVGFGRVVQWQIKQISDLNIKVEFICDNCKEKLLEAEKLIPQAKTFESLENMLIDPDIPEVDYIIVATPSGSHYKIAELISQYKSWNIIIEKPTFLKPVDFQYAKLWENKIIPIFQNRYNKSVVKAKEIIEKKA